VYLKVMSKTFYTENVFYLYANTVNYVLQFITETIDLLKMIFLG